MPSTVTPGPVGEDACVREAVCIHTKKIFDSCKAKDCIEDVRVYISAATQQTINSAYSVKPKCAELIYVCSDISEVTFNRGFYNIEVKYYYKITGVASTCTCASEDFCGLAVFEKRVFLFGSESRAKVFSSDSSISASCRSDMPTVVTEAVDPILLDMRLVECPKHRNEIVEIPNRVLEVFSDGICTDSTGRQLYVTLGQFSIVRLERDTQLLIPTYDYCVPNKDCTSGCSDEPCQLFSRIEFPVDEFFPPDTVCDPGCYREALNILNK